MQNPYPNHYSPAFAFSGIPYPLVHRFTLAGDLPLPVETRGLTTFRTSTIPGGVRLCLSAGGTTSAGGELAAPPTSPPAFWLKPLSLFGLLAITTAQQQFTWVSHTLQP